MNPQFLSGSVTTAVANTPVQVQFRLPISRLPTGGGATVIEVLKIYVDWALNEAVASAVEIAKDQFFSFTTSPTATAQPLNISNPLALMADGARMNGAFTAGGSYYNTNDARVDYDLTDGAGHGVLVGTDSLYCQYDTNGFTGLATFGFRILYRFKNVSLAEYIGIVQSQSVA